MNHAIIRFKKTVVIVLLLIASSLIYTGVTTLHRHRMAITQEIPPVFFINTEKAVVRRTLMWDKLKQAGIHHAERFVAIQPEDITFEYSSPDGSRKIVFGTDMGQITNWHQVKICYSPTESFYWDSSCGMWPGEFACYCSHRNLWKKIVDEQITCAIILEDDVLLSPSFLPLLKQVLGELPKNWHYCNLRRHGSIKNISCLHRHILGVWNSLFQARVHVCAYYGAGFWGTEGYIISQEGARALLAATQVSSLPVDLELGRLFGEGVVHAYHPCGKLTYGQEPIGTLEPSIVRCNINETTMQPISMDST